MYNPSPGVNVGRNNNLLKWSSLENYCCHSRGYHFLSLYHQEAPRLKYHIRIDKVVKYLLSSLEGIGCQKVSKRVGVNIHSQNSSVHRCQWWISELSNERMTTVKICIDSFTPEIWIKFEFGHGGFHFITKESDQVWCSSAQNWNNSIRD